jgi:hypothetical protein
MTAVWLIAAAGLALIAAKCAFLPGRRCVSVPGPGGAWQGYPFPGYERRRHG